ncbi:MAG TPA: endolytic transglycosylase MltG [Candidatus Limnocylindrales bacterium]
MNPLSRGGYDDGWAPDPRQVAPAARRERNGGGSGLPGFLKFLIFAVVLAAVVLTVLVTALRPIVRGAIVGWAGDNPGALHLPFVADLVREDLGDALNRPASSDPTDTPFTVNTGDTASAIADRLAAAGLVGDRRAFVFVAIDKGLATKLSAGNYVLRKNMTPTELVTTLLSPPKVLYVDIGLREGLRIEQVAAKLQTLPLKMDVKQFYDLAKHPPASLIDAHPWLAALKLPAGTSLEGFLYPATYRVLPDTTAEQFISMMLDKFYDAVGKDRINVPKSRGMSFYEIVTLASLVEHEARFDEDRPLIAGVFQNRLNPKLFPTHLLGSDPTIFYIHDSLQLAAMPFTDWPKYLFWAPLGAHQLPKTLPPDLAGYNTTTHGGLIPGPISTPSLASIDAALHPDTKAGYLYFLAKPDGSTVYAKTFAEHQRNIVKYGAQP